MSDYSIERQIKESNKWITICDGIESLHQVNTVANMLSTHQVYGGTYRIYLYYGRGQHEFICVWINGEQKTDDEFRK